MKTTEALDNSPSLAMCVAPEDLNCGDYVTPLNVVCELPSFLWFGDVDGIQPDEPVRIQFRCSSGTPLKVKAICLPFLFVKGPNGKSQTLDVRQSQLVRLNPTYASIVWKELKTRQ